MRMRYPRTRWESRDTGGCAPRPERFMRQCEPISQPHLAKLYRGCPDHRPMSSLGECAPARVVSMLRGMSRGAAEDSGKPLEIKGTGLQHDATCRAGAAVLNFTYELDFIVGKIGGLARN